MGGAPFASAAFWRPRPPLLANRVRRGLAGRLLIGSAPVGGAHTPWRHGSWAGAPGPGFGPAGAWSRAWAQGPSGDAIRERGTAAPMALKGSEV